MQPFLRKEEVTRHYAWHKKKEDFLRYGFMRVGAREDCSKLTAAAVSDCTAATAATATAAAAASAPGSSAGDVAISGRCPFKGLHTHYQCLQVCVSQICL